MRLGSNLSFIVHLKKPHQFLFKALKQSFFYKQVSFSNRCIKLQI